jgi:peptidoglycan/LPS O-acetylase OafA/YrhL/lysophospholipase L1-like esterase
MTVERQPALDGVRALALVLVLFFHAGFSWMPAGYLGVSVFFTLSGYLITNLLLTEFDSSNQIRLGTFYSRRWKRLLPAGLLCLVGIVVLRFAGAFGAVQHLRRDLTAATLQVFNWTELSRGTSYADLFTASADELSPVKHYWSLAIEEQFYLLWPVVLLLLARQARRRDASVLWPVAALTAAFVIAAPVIGRVFGPDAAYWATPARFGEILVGATLACVMRSPWAAGRAPSSLVGTALAAGGLAVIVVSSVILPSDGGPAFTGWLGLFALASVGLIVGLQAPGPLRRVLSWRPLVLVGLVSYAAYLFHWPVFVLLASRDWPLSSTPSFAVAVTITLGLAAVSYRLVEHPIRVRTWSPGRVGGAAIAASVVTLVAVLVAPPSSGGFLVADRGLLDAAAIRPAHVVTRLERAVSTSTTAPAAATTIPAATAPADVPASSAPSSSTATVAIEPVAPPASVPLPLPPNRPVRILVVGDSTAFYIGHGLARWAVDHPDEAQVDLLWSQGFGLLTTGAVTAWDGSAFVERSIEVLDTDLPAQIARLQPDVVVMMITIDDVLDRVWDDAEGEISAADERFRARLHQAYRDTTASIVAQGVPSVVWIVPPVPVDSSSAEELNDPATFETQHETIRRVVGELAPATTAIELDRWMVAGGHDLDESWRPDGTHLTEASAAVIAEMMLGPTLVNTAVAG